MNESDGNSNPAVQNAFRNELVSLEIFKYLKLDTLLCCSLVNKNWNYQVRKYIRDYRKCTLIIPKQRGSSSSVFPCSPAGQLIAALDRMAVVPFNSLKIVLEPHRHRPATRLQSRINPQNEPEDMSSSVSQWENLLSKLQLKFLSISWAEHVDYCDMTLLIPRILLEKGTEIKSLEFVQIPKSFAENFALQQKQGGKPLEFPKLEELILIERFRTWCNRQDLFREILAGSPKLKRLIHDGFCWILNMNPKDKYRLLHHLSPWAYSDKLNSHPPFENLRTLTLDCNKSQGDFLKFYTRLEFRRLFPKLQTIDLLWDEPKTIGRLEPRKFVDDHYDDDEDDLERVDLPDSCPHISKAAKKLILRVEACELDYQLLAKKFPEITELQLFPGDFFAHQLNYRGIFRFWPNLKKLSLTGRVYAEEINVDQVFCGVSQEELELLWTYGEKYLKCLHIVPIRPCLLTMSKLESIEIELELARSRHKNYRRTKRSCMFLSPVTKILVFDRMPWLDVRLHFS